MIIKLRNRLIAAIMAFVSIIMLVAFIAIYMVTYVRIYNENMERINSNEFVTVTSDGQMILDGQTITDAFVINRISPALGVYFNLIYDSSGNLVLIDSVLDLSREDYETAALMAMKKPEGAITELAGRKWQHMTAFSATYQFEYHDSPVQTGDLTLIRYLDITDSYKTLETLLFTLMGLYLVLMVVFVILARYFANRSIRPLAEAWEAQQRFIADASHELKTPISTLSANLDVLYASQEDLIKDQIKWLDNSKKVLFRMTSLIQSMLDLAKADEISNQHPYEEVAVNQLLDEIADSYTPLAQKRSITITEDLNAPVYVYNNYTMMQQVLEILMDNAIKYGDEGGDIRISAAREKNDAVIKVRNTGEGISPADIDKVFDRFYRGDKARVYQEGNYGLGLSIAKSIVDKMGARISVESEADWTCFSVRVPYRKPGQSF